MEIFASPSFLDRWILNKDLDFEAVSIDGWSDGTDAVCITHKLLRISLTPESYQMLGLTGRKSTQAKDRYVIDIKLDGQHFRPGHRYFEKVKQAFERCKKTILMWVTVTRDGQPIDFNFEGDSVHVPIQYKVTTMETCWMPRLPPRTHPHDAFWAKHEILHDLFDWLSALSLGIKDFVPPNLPKDIKTTLQKHQWTGMITTAQILQTVEVTRTCMEQNLAPWIAILVHGFKDTPLSFLPPSDAERSTFDQLVSTDHSVLDDVSGENDYILLLRPDQQFSIFVAAGSGDNFTKL